MNHYLFLRTVSRRVFTNQFQFLAVLIFANKRLFKAAVKLTIVILSRVTLDVIERDDERSTLISVNHIEQPI